MAPPAIIVVNCYIYRDLETKLWVAETRDVRDCKATCMQPEDALRRIQSLALDRVSSQIAMHDLPLTSNIQVMVNTTVVDQNEAYRLLHSSPVYDEDDGDLLP